MHTYKCSWGNGCYPHKVIVWLIWFKPIFPTPRAKELITIRFWGRERGEAAGKRLPSNLHSWMVVWSSILVQYFVLTKEVTLKIWPTTWLPISVAIMGLAQHKDYRGKGDLNAGLSCIMSAKVCIPINFTPLWYMMCVCLHTRGSRLPELWREIKIWL